MAKTNSGRCRNNQPLHINSKGLFADVDIQGCCGNGLKHKEYPFGKPVIYDLPLNSDCNIYLSLREFLALYEEMFVPGLWFLRVSIYEPLENEQDYFMSWYPSKDLMSTDRRSEDHIDDGKNVKNDYRKIYSKEIRLAVFSRK